VVQQEHSDKLSNQLISQGFIISFLLNHSFKALNSLWSSTQSKLPKNIFNFTIRYLNNTLATRNNLQKWNLSQSSDCSFCLKSETLLHVVAGCKNIWKKVATHGDTTQHFILLPQPRTISKIPPFLSTFQTFSPPVSLLVSNFVLICFFPLLITSYI